MPAARMVQGGPFASATRLPAVLGACLLTLFLAPAPRAHAVVPESPASQTRDAALASPPFARSVTVYRAPARKAGSFDLEDLDGFALVTETRHVSLPAGDSKLRFENLAGGIEAASALVQGLPADVVEKNREGKLLSPSALVDAAVGHSLSLVRTDRKNGRRERVPVKLLSAADGGVVFQTPDGLEALRCSGLSETLEFSETRGLSASPTLSVEVRTARAVSATVTLSYLAEYWDWAADYSATLSADSTTMDLGAWITLANGNGQGFAHARTQVVAGRLNRESGDVEPVERGGSLLANCWPSGSTSDIPLRLIRARSRGQNAPDRMFAIATAARLEEVSVTAQRRTAELEQLGDLKLYRLPGDTDILGLESKQVRLLDRTRVPVALVYGADFETGDEPQEAPADVLLRTRNDLAHHLGLPLPSGRISVYVTGQEAPVLRFETLLRDLAVDEEVEIPLGRAADISVRLVPERNEGKVHRLRAELTSAKPHDVPFELRLRLPDGARIDQADHPLEMKNGRPLFRLVLKARSMAAVTFSIIGAS